MNEDLLSVGKCQEGCQFKKKNNNSKLKVKKSKTNSKMKSQFCLSILFSIKTQIRGL